MRRLIILSVGGLLVIGILFFTLRRSEEPVKNSTSGVSSAEVMQKDPMMDTMEKGDVMEMVEVEEEVRMAVLEPANDSIKDSMGTAKKTIVDSKLYHIIEATMPDPAEGSVYEGWLVQKDPLDFFSTGLLSQNAKGDWTLEFIGAVEAPTYNLVVVTEETIVDDTPEGHIIEGSFKSL